MSIDEILFSNSAKINYSWIANNKTNIWSNSSFQGFLLIITAITCKGDWFNSNLIFNENSDNFKWFIEHPMTWLRDDIGVQTNRIVLLMDNPRLHTSIKCKKFLIYWDEEYCFSRPIVHSLHQKNLCSSTEAETFNPLKRSNL